MSENGQTFERREADLLAIIAHRETELRQASTDARQMRDAIADLLPLVSDDDLAHEVIRRGLSIEAAAARIAANQ